MQCALKATTKKFLSNLKNNQVSQKLKKMRTEWLRVTDFIGKKLFRLGIPANLVSISGFAIGLLAINFLAMGSYFSALICILLNRLFDAVDGAIARNSEPSDFGVFLDACLDYAFYAGVVFGFALAYPAQNAVAACFLMFGFTAAAAALLAYAVIAYKNSCRNNAAPEQSPFYLGGFAQGGEMLAAAILLCLFPSWFMPAAIVLGCWSLVKALMVITTAYYNFVIAAKGRR